MDAGNKVTTYNLLYNKIISPNTPKENTQVFPWLQMQVQAQKSIWLTMKNLNSFILTCFQIHNKLLINSI